MPAAALLNPGQDLETRRGRPVVVRHRNELPACHNLEHEDMAMMATIRTV
ncbi:MAG TPA: hypothetical protein VKZ81_04915 [Pseudonocardia sp.]|nr:hypothetical protein [Pseudonocardia sp.]HLU54781.1 hypothetical protein [Pseudonocardia sp.]